MLSTTTDKYNKDVKDYRNIKYKKNDMGVEQFNMDNINEADAQLRHRKNNKNDSCLENSQKVYFEYCSMTSVHGFQYFGSGRTRIEVFWWMIVFTVCFASCIYMVLELSYKWIDSPVIVNIAVKETRIQDIPFPAVTICPVSSVSTEIEGCHKYEYYKNSTYLTEEEKKMGEYTRIICEEDPNENDQQYISRDIYRYLHKCYGNLHMEAKWMGKSYPSLSDLFVPILTNGGVCYTFNSIGRDLIYKETVEHIGNYLKVNETVVWDSEDGYAENASRYYAYPRRGLSSGSTSGLHLEISENKNNFDYSCFPIQGYQVILHLPSRIPIPNMEGFFVGPGRGLMLPIEPNRMVTSKTVKSYNKYDRNCLTPNENILKYFNIYSKFNCEIECATNLTLTLCGCVSFHMPKFKDMEICGHQQSVCVEMATYLSDLWAVISSKSEIEANKIILNKMNEVNEEFPENKFNFDSTTVTKIFQNIHCDCLPLCTDIVYDAEESYYMLDIKNVISSDILELFDLQDTSFTFIDIYFKRNLVPTLERNELFGTVDFISEFAGIVGLFTGFSVVSFIEIIYFLSLRMFGNIKIFGNWYGKDDEEVEQQISHL